jgi:hypothetical protein
MPNRDPPPLTHGGNADAELDYDEMLALANSIGCSN